MTLRNSSLNKRIVNNVLNWVSDRPWVMQSVIGLMWIYEALVGLGKGQDWSVFCAFLGMLWWALLEKDLQDLRHDFGRAMKGWAEAVDALLESEDGRPSR